MVEQEPAERKRLGDSASMTGTEKKTCDTSKEYVMRSALVANLVKMHTWHGSQSRQILGGLVRTETARPRSPHPIQIQRKKHYGQATWNCKKRISQTMTLTEKL